MMPFRPLSRLLLVFLIGSIPTLADKDPKNGKVPPISNNTRIEVIRLLNAEYVWARKALPMGEKGVSIRPNGEIDPGDVGTGSSKAYNKPAADRVTADIEDDGNSRRSAHCGPGSMLTGGVDDVHHPAD